MLCGWVGGWVCGQISQKLSEIVGLMEPIGKYQGESNCHIIDDVTSLKCFIEFLLELDDLRSVQFSSVTDSRSLNYYDDCTNA